MTLRNISLSIAAGQKVALVGRTGSGKSTLARLLLGLYQPTRGEICYDGVPLRLLDFRSVRSQWGVVLQESFLFSGSIRQNIAFNHPAMPLAEVTEAARRACIHEEIGRILAASGNRNVEIAELAPIALPGTLVRWMKARLQGT